MARLRSRPAPSDVPITASVLVVDDDLVVGRSLCRALNAMLPGFRVELVPSGEAALDWLRQNPCDVIVTDLDMGRLSGSALLQTLASEFPRIIRIVHSSRKEALESRELRQLIHDSLEKPARPTHIAELITRHVGSTSK